jgi:hypothetical protein
MPASSWGTTIAPASGFWREKRGEIEPEDLSGNLIVQLGAVTEDLCLFPVFMRFLEAHARPSAVFVDELDPGRLQGPPDCRVIRRGHRSLIIGELSTADCGYP